MAEGLQGATGSEIRASDADDHNDIDSLGFPAVADVLKLLDLALGNVHRKSLPSEEVIARSVLCLKGIERGKSLLYVILIICGRNETVAAGNVNFYHSIAVFGFSSQLCKNTKLFSLVETKRAQACRIFLSFAI